MKERLLKNMVNKNHAQSKLFKKIKRAHLRNPELFAIIHTMTSAICYSCYSLLAHKYSPDVTISQIGFCGNFTTLAFGIIQAYFRGESLIPMSKTGKKATMLFGLCGMIFFYMFVYFSMKIPASIFIIILNTSSIVSVFLGPLLASEKFDTIPLILALISLIGIIFAIKPDLLGLPSSSRASETSSLIIIICFSMPFISVCLNLFIRNYVEKMSLSQCSMGMSFCNMMLFAIIGTFTASNSLSLRDFLIAEFFGIALISNQYFFMIALVLTKKPSTQIVIYSSQVVITYILDSLINNVPITMIGAIGVAIFFGSIVLIGIYDAYISKRNNLAYTVLFFDDGTIHKRNRTEEDDDDELEGKMLTSLGDLINRN